MKLVRGKEILYDITCLESKTITMNLYTNRRTQTQKPAKPSLPKRPEGGIMQGPDGRSELTDRNCYT